MCAVSYEGTSPQSRGKNQRYCEYSNYVLNGSVIITWHVVLTKETMHDTHQESLGNLYEASPLLAL